MMITAGQLLLDIWLYCTYVIRSFHFKRIFTLPIPAPVCVISLLFLLLSVYCLQGAHHAGADQQEGEGEGGAEV
jgi:hypothetical protein